MLMVDKKPLLPPSAEFQPEESDPAAQPSAAEIPASTAPARVF